MVNDYCVYDCVHPLWGGSGYCEEVVAAAAAAAGGGGVGGGGIEGAGSSGDDGGGGGGSVGGEAAAAPLSSSSRLAMQCVCDAGFASRDAMGHASCVPTRVLMNGYLTISVTGAVMALFLAWHINAFRYLLLMTKRTRKARLRLRILLCGCGTAIGFSTTYSIAAASRGTVNLWDSYMIQTMYVLCVPMVMFAFPLLVEYWVEALPPLLIQTPSMAATLKEQARNFDFFLKAAMVMAASLVLCGVVSFFDARWALRVADVITVIGSNVSGLGTWVVAAQIAHFINHFQKQARGDIGFYVRAKTRLWTQMLGLYVIIGINTGSVIMLYYTETGRSTPTIYHGFHSLCAVTVFAPFAHFTTFGERSEGKTHRSKYSVPKQDLTSTFRLTKRQSDREKNFSSPAATAASIAARKRWLAALAIISANRHNSHSTADATAGGRGRGGAGGGGARGGKSSYPFSSPKKNKKIAPIDDQAEPPSVSETMPGGGIMWGGDEMSCSITFADDVP